MLFSIPVHENIFIVKNQIENIFKYNPKSFIVLHINTNLYLIKNLLNIRMYLLTQPS